MSRLGAPVSRSSHRVQSVYCFVLCLWKVLCKCLGGVSCRMAYSKDLCMKDMMKMVYVMCVLQHFIGPGPMSSALMTTASVTVTGKE